MPKKSKQQITYLACILNDVSCDSPIPVFGSGSKLIFDTLNNLTVVNYVALVVIDDRLLDMSSVDNWFSHVSWKHLTRNMF